MDPFFLPDLHFLLYHILVNGNQSDKCNISKETSFSPSFLLTHELPLYPVHFTFVQALITSLPGTPDDFISLSPGWPATSLFPVHHFLHIAIGMVLKTMSDHGVLCLQFSICTLLFTAQIVCLTRCFLLSDKMLSHAYINVLWEFFIFSLLVKKILLIVAFHTYIRKTVFSQL